MPDKDINDNLDPTSYEWDDSDFFADADSLAITPETPPLESPSLSQDEMSPDAYEWDDEDFFTGEESAPSEIGAAWDVGWQRTKGLAGKGFQLLAEQLQESAKKRSTEETREFAKEYQKKRPLSSMFGALSPSFRPMPDEPEIYDKHIEWGKDIKASAQAELDKLPQAPEFVKSGDWWENLKDPETRAGQLTWMIGSNVQPTIAIAAAALMAGVATGPLGATTVGTGGAYLLESGSSYDDLTMMGVPAEDARDTASIVGAVNAALEIAPLGRIASKVPALRKLIGAQVQKDLLKKNVLRRSITEMVKQGSFESATEALQEVVQNAGKKVYDENQEYLAGTGEAAFVGGILGGVFGAGGAVLPQGRVDAPTPEIEDAGRAQIADPITGEAIVPPTVDPETGRPSLFKEEVKEAQQEVEIAAKKAGISQEELSDIAENTSSERTKKELDDWFDSQEDSAAEPVLDPKSVAGRASKLKQEAAMQTAALEAELSGEDIIPGVQEVADVVAPPIAQAPIDTMATAPTVVEDVVEQPAAKITREIDPVQAADSEIVTPVTVSPDLYAAPVTEAAATVAEATAVAPPVDMGSILKSTGPIKAYAEAKGHKWPMGPNSKKYKALREEYNFDKQKYEDQKALEDAKVQEILSREEVREIQEVKGTKDELQLQEVNVEQWKEQIPGLSGQAYKGLSELQTKAGPTREREQLQILRDRIAQTGEDTPTAMRSLWGPGLANAPSRLRPALRDYVAVPALPGAVDRVSKADERAAGNLKMIMMPPETVEIEETGERVVIEETAESAVARVDSRLDKLYKLRECLRS